MVVLSFCTGAVPAAFAQQDVPFEEGIPVAPTGLAGKPLGDGPFAYPTAEQQDIRITILTRGLEYPYSLAFLPTGELLVTERAGRLRTIRDGVLDPKPVPGGPASVFKGKSGMIGAMHGYMSLAVHPRFSENHWIYFSYSKPHGADAVTAVARARFDGSALSEVHDVFTGTAHYGAVALTMTPDAMLWIATSGDDAQDPQSFGGKVLRLHEDGSVPKDNPFVGNKGYLPEIYSLGHRSSLGLTVRPGTTEVWLSEMGPNGGDEINLIKSGRNYGWPLVSLGRSYSGEWHAEGGQPTHEGYEYPYVYWMPAISVSGLAFYDGDRLPRWKGDLFVGGLRMGEIPGTGHLERILFNEKMEELRRESLLVDLRQRIRDVKQGPDGLLYVATDEEQGAILRIEPAN
jgi:glucose/arabinose dehydrogenase